MDTYQIVIAFFGYILIMFAALWMAWLFITQDADLSDKIFGGCIMLICIFLLAWGAGIL